MDIHHLDGLFGIAHCNFTSHFPLITFHTSVLVNRVKENAMKASIILLSDFVECYYLDGRQLRL